MTTARRHTLSWHLRCLRERLLHPDGSDEKVYHYKLPLAFVDDMALVLTEAALHFAEMRRDARMSALFPNGQRRATKARPRAK